MRDCHAYGAETVKVNVSGEELVLGADVKSTFTAEHVRCIVQEAHALGMCVAAHARGHASVRDAITGGVDVLLHCDFAGADGVQLILDTPSLLLGPSMGFLRRVTDMTGGALPDDPGFGADKKLAASVSTHRELLLRGGSAVSARLGVGGDWCFPQTPHGGAAYDMEIYVNDLGMTPVAALECATSAGAAFMCSDVGHLRVGSHADIIACVGDPTIDVTCLQRPLALVVLAGHVIVADERFVTVEEMHDDGTWVTLPAASIAADATRNTDASRITAALTEAYQRHFADAPASDVTRALTVALGKR